MKDSTQMTFEDLATVKGPDRWIGQTYIHYNKPYVIDYRPHPTRKGEYICRSIQAMQLAEEVKK